MTDYDKGRFEALYLISNAWYGKQYYFAEDEAEGIIYSRESEKAMTLDEAIEEFARKVMID